MIFLFKHEIFGVALHQNSKNGNFCKEKLSENDVYSVLATFCCYEHGAKADEAVQKIAIDQKEYHKFSLCVIIC